VRASITSVPLEPALAADALADAAERTLRRLLDSGDESRAIAGDLLVADALVTWACEAAAEQWATGDAPAAALEDWCDAFARRLGGIAGAALRPTG
jgi:hypothetical protein